jgi:hypothetical protein
MQTHLQCTFTLTLRKSPNSLPIRSEILARGGGTPLGIVMGTRNLWVTAMGMSGIRVRVQTFVPTENPYPQDGYNGFDPKFKLCSTSTAASSSLETFGLCPPAHV